MKITIFAPFAQITVHNLAEIKLAEILVNNGHEVNFIQCDKTFIDQCTVLDSNGVESNADRNIKNKYCRDCVGQRNNYRKIPNLNYISTKDFENHYENAIIPMDTNIMINYELDGIKIGRIASFETLIKFKKSNFDFNSEQLEHLNSWLSSGVKSYYVAKRYFELYEADLVIIYSPQYNIPGVFSEVALSRGIRTISFDGSGNDSERYSHVRLHDWSIYGLREPALFHLDKFKNYSPNKLSLKRATQQAREFPKTKSFNAYSRNKQMKNTFDFFNLDSKKKTLLVAMSSYDEVFSGVVIDRLSPVRFNGKVFDSQIEWIRHVIDWAKANPNIQVIIRPHPREFPNRRDSSTADHTKKWEILIQDLPNNIRVDHPDLKFSIYDHFESIDALTTGWSTTGLIALLHEIPVVSYDSEIVTFPKSIHFSGDSIEEYDQNLLEALNSGRKIIFKHDAIRWLAYLSDVGTVKITHRIGDSFGNLWVRRIINSRYFKFLRTKLEFSIPPSNKDARRIEEIVQGRNSFY